MACSIQPTYRFRPCTDLDALPPTLKELRLSGIGRISDAEVDALKKLPTLEKLDLSETRGTDLDGAPLMAAAENGHPEVVEALLKANADVNATTNDGRTAPMAAAENGHPEVVEALLRVGADVNAKAANGETAMSLATKGGVAEIVQLLKEFA